MFRSETGNLVTYAALCSAALLLGAWAIGPTAALGADNRSHQDSSYSSDVSDPNRGQTDPGYTTHDDGSHTIHEPFRYCNAACRERGYRKGHPGTGDEDRAGRSRSQRNTGDVRGEKCNC